jgi:hypothetical protein
VGSIMLLVLVAHWLAVGLIFSSLMTLIQNKM